MSCVPNRVPINEDFEDFDPNEPPLDQLTFIVNRDEPIFILRAQDLAAPYAVFEWAKEAASRGAAEAKWQDAHRIAREMIAWQGAKKVPD